MKAQILCDEIQDPYIFVAIEVVLSLPPLRLTVKARTDLESQLGLDNRF